MDGYPDHDELADRLQRHGVSLTHQRMEIAAVLFRAMEHLSADQILARANARNAQVSKATVYNTLKLFLERGLVREVIVDPGKVFYDPNVAPHHHLYDVTTGRLTDIPAQAITLASLPQLPEGVVVEGVDIVIRTRPRGAT